MKAIYGLFDPVSEKCLYVGRTGNIEAREIAHTLKLTVTPALPFQKHAGESAAARSE